MSYYHYNLLRLLMDVAFGALNDKIDAKISKAKENDRWMKKISR